MAISFEQPAPFNAQLAARYGAMQAQGRGGGGGGGGGGGSIQQSVDRAADRSMQEAQSNEDRMSRQSIAEMNARAGTENANADRQNRLLAGDQEGQYRMAQQRLQGELQQTELTQTESIRLNRMKQAVGTVEADDNLGPSEKQALITQLRTGINPYESRLAATKVQQEELQTQQMTSQRQKMAAWDMADAVTRKKMATDTLVELDDPHSPTGKSQYTVDPKTNQFHRVEQSAPAKAGKVEKYDTQSFNFALHKKDAMAEAETAYPKMAGEGPEQEEKRLSYFQEIMKRESDTFNQGRTTMAGQKKSAGSQQEDPWRDPPADLPDQQRAILDSLPTFSLANPVNDKQKSMVSDYRGKLESLDKRTNLDAGQKKAAKDSLDQAMAMLEKYRGSTAAMPADDLKKFLELKKQYEWNSVDRRPPPEKTTEQEIQGTTGMTTGAGGDPGRSSGQKFQDGDWVTSKDIGDLWNKATGLIGS